MNVIAGTAPAIHTGSLPYLKTQPDDTERLIMTLGKEAPFPRSLDLCGPISHLRCPTESGHYRTQ